MADSKNELSITFGENLRVNAQIGDFEIHTDQSVKNGGDASAPEPFALFLASLGTCAGLYVHRFCQKRNIPTDGVRIIQRIIPDEVKKRIGKVELDIEVPADFPEKYHDAIVRAANGCAVKKYLQDPFEIETRTVVK